jgi:TolB-like protein/cytochrome c-type biogenesis protein CcmH/NrfG
MPRDDEGGTWAKLRRRKLVQWGLAYAAAAWVLLQVFGFAADSFGWPVIAKQLAMLGLAIGLPVAAVLAWYHGDRGQQRITRSEFVIVALLLLLGGGLVIWWGRVAEAPGGSDIPRAPASAAMDDRSIAVLPFVNMSSDPEQEYFSDGMAEQVLDQLSRIPDLRVIARTSSFAFRNKEVDVATIAQQLHVSHLLEGSVRKAGNRVRITAQLIRAADSSHLWSETYDRELTDVFAIQDEIAAAVVQQLKVTLFGGRLPGRSTTANLDAYSLYLQGRYLYERHSREDMEKAVSLYRQALDIDPSYAPAWAALAEAGWVLAAEGYHDVNAAARESLEAARKAVVLDPQLVMAHSTMGDVQSSYYWDWPAADASFKKALEYDPNDMEATFSSAFLAMGSGRVDDAIALFRRAVTLSPISPSAHEWLSHAYLVSNRLEDAEKEIRTALELSPDLSQGWYRLGLVLLEKGQARAALEAMQRERAENWRLPGLALAWHALGRRTESDAALKEATDKYADTMAYQIAEVYAYRGEVDEALAWLERAYRQRDSGLACCLKTDPLMKSVKDDARYAALLRKMKLPLD